MNESSIYMYICVFTYIYMYLPTSNSLSQALMHYSFIHSGHFYSAPWSPLLLRGAPDYSTDTVLEFHAEAHRQLQVKDLPKVPTWRLERESNPRPSGWKSSSQPRRHHVPHVLLSLSMQDRRSYYHYQNNLQHIFTQRVVQIYDKISRLPVTRSCNWI